MTISSIIISVLAIGIIISGILLLKKSAKRFNITPEQLAKIKKRNEVLEKEEQHNK